MTKEVGWMDPFFIAGLLTDLSDIPLYAYDGHGLQVHIFCHHEDALSLSAPLVDLRNEVLGATGDEKVVYRQVKHMPIVMMAYACKEDGYTYLWGPIRYRELSDNEYKRYDEWQKGASLPTLCSHRRLVAGVASFISMVTGTQTTTKEIDRFIELKRGKDPVESINADVDKVSEKTRYLLANQDHERLNHTYAEEQVVWEAVKKGDVEKVKRLSALPRQRYPMVIENDPLKNESYMAVSAVTMLARAAIEAGVTSAESFTLSDLFLKKISECRYLHELQEITIKADLEFTEMVRATLSQRSLNNYVEDCKRDITTKVFEKISLATIAADLGIQPSYLSRLFKEHEGITVTDYIHDRKLELAKNMLKYSDRTIADIADYLKFNSQSYFGNLFKKKTGMTPKTYRQVYHPNEF